MSLLNLIPNSKTENNETQTFIWMDHPVRAINKNGEAWFVAKDICEMLELENSRKATGKLKESQKGVTEIYTLGGKQNMTIINQPATLKLVLRSNKPEAEQIQDWLCEEVIPQILKTGSYGVPKQLSRKDLALLVIEAEEENEKLKLANTEQQKQISTMKPVCDFVDRTFKYADTNILIGDFAQVMAIPDPKNPKVLLGRNKMFKILRHAKILKPDNLPMQQYQNAGLFVVKERISKQNGKDKIFLTTYVTPKGQVWLHKRILDEVS